MTVFVIVILALFTGLIYAFLLLFAKLVRSYRAPYGKADKNKKHKLRMLVASFSIAALTTYFFLFTSPATNYKTAYIEKEQESYKVIVKGKREYMAHDPVSMFLRKTYEDSIQYILPRSEGVIKGQELPTKKGYYKLVGNIIIKDEQLKINLYSDNYDKKNLDVNPWNGNYNLVWRQK
jgi:hypothetical protein